jgi:hypothetical protein
VLFTDLKLGIIVAHIKQIASIAEGLSREAGSYMKCLADRFQLKFRKGKTKRKKPPHY